LRGAGRGVDAAEEGTLPQLRSYRLAELTSPEVADGLAGGIDSVILPVGSTEQHDAYLPFSTRFRLITPEYRGSRGMR